MSKLRADARAFLGFDREEAFSIDFTFLVNDLVAVGT